MDVRELIPQAQKLNAQTPYPGLWRGTFTAPIPAATTDLAWVTLVDLPIENLFGPCYWEPRIREVTTDVSESPESVHNITVGRILMPTLGDLVLMGFDNQRYPWIVRWWPA